MKSKPLRRHYVTSDARTTMGVVGCAAILLWPISAQAESAEACIRDFANPYNVTTTALSPRDYRDSCLRILESSDMPDAAYVTGRIHAANGDYKAASEWLQIAASHGSDAARFALLALDMARFHDQYPNGWISSESPIGVNVKYVLEYTAIKRSVRAFSGDEARSPLLHDLVFGYDPSADDRSRALKSLLEEAESGRTGALLAQRLVGRRLHNGSITPRVLKDADIIKALNGLFGTPSNFELIWWVGCADTFSYIYNTPGIRVLDKDLAGTDPRSLLELGLRAAEANGFAAEPEWWFRRLLFNLENPDRPIAELTDAIAELERLSSLGYRDATNYLDSSAVSEVINAYGKGSFNPFTTDLCHHQARIVFDTVAALAWWSKRIEGGDCEAIADLNYAKESLAAKGGDRELPKTSKEPMRLLGTCRSPIESYYLDLG